MSVYVGFSVGKTYIWYILSVYVCSEPLLGDKKKLFLLHLIVNVDDFTEVKMAEDIKTKLQHYRTAPFDARFPNQNQTRNCWANYVGRSSEVLTFDLSAASNPVWDFMRHWYDLSPWNLDRGHRLFFLDIHCCCFSINRLSPLPESPGY